MLRPETANVEPHGRPLRPTTGGLWGSPFSERNGNHYKDNDDAQPKMPQEQSGTTHTAGPTIRGVEDAENFFTNYICQKNIFNDAYQESASAADSVAPGNQKYGDWRKMFHNPHPLLLRPNSPDCRERKSCNLVKR